MCLFHYLTLIVNTDVCHFTDVCLFLNIPGMRHFMTNNQFNNFYHGLKIIIYVMHFINTCTCIMFNFLPLCIQVTAIVNINYCL